MLLNDFWEVSMIWAAKICHRLSGRNEMCPSKISCYIPWRNTLGNDLYSMKHSTNLLWFVFLLVTSLAEVASSAYPLLLVYAVWEQSLASISSCPLRLFPLRPLCMLTAWWLTAALCLWPRFLLLASVSSLVSLRQVCCEFVCFYFPATCIFSAAKKKKK